MNKHSFPEVQLNFNSTGPFRKTHSPSLSLGSTINSLSQPRLLVRPDAPIVCKKIDNAPLTITIDQPTNKPFVPLAIPLEKPKKVLGTSETTKSRNESKERTTGNYSLPISRNTSTTQITPQNRLNGVEVNGLNSKRVPDPKEQKNKKSKSSPKKKELVNSKSTKDFKQPNLVRIKEQPKTSQEKRILNPSESKQDIKQDLRKDHRNGLPQNKSLEKHHKHKKSQENIKRPEPKVQNFFQQKDIDQSTERTPSHEHHHAHRHKKHGHKPHMRKTVQHDRNEHHDRKATQKARHTFQHHEKSVDKSNKSSVDRLKSSSRSPFRVGLNESTSRVLNRDKSSEKKKKSSKPIPPEFNEKVRENAQRYLEEIKRDKEDKQYRKLIVEERKTALEEGNKRIRDANLKRFNIVPKKAAGGKHSSKPKYAWGADQRRLNARPSTGLKSHENSRSPEKKKLFQDDNERRKRLGLDNIDDETLNNMRKKSSYKSSMMVDSSSHESFHQNKSKRQLAPEDREKLLEFMHRKKQQIENEQEAKKLEKFIDLEKKRGNLEQLFVEIRENRAKDHLTQRKSTKRKSKKNSPMKDLWSVSKEPQKDSENQEQMISMKESDDENYSLLYNEYKKIIRSKQGPKYDATGVGRKTATGQESTPQSQQELRGNFEAHQEFEQRKENVKQKFFELSNRYQKNLTSNIQIIENSLNRSSRDGARSDNSPEQRARRLQQGEYEEPDAIMEGASEHSSQDGYINQNGINYPVRGHYDQEPMTEERSSEQPEGDMIDEAEYEQEEEEEEEEEYVQDSYREIIEAAAIFIQKNWRGYRTRSLLREYFQQLCEEDLEMDPEEYEAEMIRRQMEDYEGPDRFGEESGGREAHTETEYEHEQQMRNKHRYQHPYVQEEEYEQEGEEVEEEDQQQFEEEEEEPEYEQEIIQAMKGYSSKKEPDSTREGMNKLRAFWEDPQEEEAENFLETNEKNNLMKLVQRQKVQAKHEVTEEAEPEPDRYEEEGIDEENEYGEEGEEGEYYFPPGEGDDPLLYDEDGEFADGFQRFRKAKSDGDLYEGRELEEGEIEGEGQGDEFEGPIESLREGEAEELEREIDSDIRRQLQRIDRRALGEEFEEDEDGLEFEDEWGEGMPGRGRYEQEEYEEEGSGEYVEEDSDQNQLQRIVDVMGDQEKMVVISTIHSDEDPDNLLQSSEQLHIPQQHAYREPKMEEEARRFEKSHEVPSRHSYGSHKEEHKPKEEITPPVQFSSGKQESGSRKGISPQEVDLSRKSHPVSEFKELSQDGAQKKHRRTHSGSENLREGLIDELNRQQGIQPSERRSVDEESKKDKTITRSDGPESSHHSASPQEKELLHKTLQLNQLYQQEINKLKEEQMKKWNDVISQLSMLKDAKDHELGSQAKLLIEHLSKQSEKNKKMLQDTNDLHELVKSISLITEEKSNTNEMEIMLNKLSNNSPPFNLPTSKDSPPKPQLETHSPQYKKKLQNKIKRPNLHIDVTAANEEEMGEGPRSDKSYTKQNSLNLDLSAMRLAFGSEQLLREHSARTQSVDTPSAKKDTANSVELDSIDLQGTENLEGLSIFERDTFKEFTRKKFQELAHHENMRKLIDMREQALEARHKTQMDHMKKMLENKRFSPRTFQNKKIELEKWVTKEKEQIQKSKRDIERGWNSTADAIKRTQRDLLFLQKVVEKDAKNASDLSLRNSYEEDTNVMSSRRLLFKGEGEGDTDSEIKSERVPRMPFLNFGSDMKSPTSLKNNIKIIDKFELKDHLLSPKQITPKTKKEAIEEFRKEIDKDFKDLAEKQGINKMPEDLASPANKYEVDAEDFVEGSLESTYKDSQGLGQKLKNLGMEIKDFEPVEQDLEKKLTESADDIPSVMKSSGRDQSPIIKRPSPDQIRRGQSNETDIEAELEPNENIEWEEDMEVGSPHKQIQENVQQRGQRVPVAMDTLDFLAGSSGNLATNKSPTSPNDIRPLINKAPREVKNEEPKSEAVMIIDQDQREAQVISDRSPEREEPSSAEKSVEHVTEEILDNLISEVENEFANGEKKHIGDKIKEMDGSRGQYNLTNLIENNHVFGSHGEKHPNFHADIGMVHEGGAIEGHPLISPIKKEDEVEEKAQQEMFKNLGIKTDMVAVAAYVDLLLGEIRGTYKEEFLRNINTPIGPSANEKLNNMHAYETMGSESSLEMSTGGQQAILSIELYLNIEQKLMEENKEKNEISIELEHIHNKMLFDSLNEVLDSFRPFGLTGQNYPWKTNIKTANQRTVNERNLETVLTKAKTRVMEWARYMCGYYGERDEFIHDKTTSFVEEYLAQVKEERLSKMLATDVHEMEDKWIVYDDEEAEVQLELADLIFDKLVSETTELIIKISDERHNKGKAPVDNKTLAALAMFERRIPGERKKSL